MNKKEIEQLALKIMDLELKAQQSPGSSEYQKEIVDITSNLSFEDILAIDDYIMTKNLLTK